MQTSARSAEIIQLDGAIATTCDKLVLVQLAPGSAINGILYSIPAYPISVFLVMIGLSFMRAMW